MATVSALTFILVFPAQTGQYTQFVSADSSWDFFVIFEVKILFCFIFVLSSIFGAKAQAGGVIRLGLRAKVIYGRNDEKSN